MNKEDVINKLVEVTKLDKEKCIAINEILENNFFVGKKNKEKIISDISSKLNMNEMDAEKIYESAMSVIGSGIKDKLKHPFGGRKQ